MSTEPNRPLSPASIRRHALGIMANGIMEVARGLRYAGAIVPKGFDFVWAEAVAAEWLDHGVAPAYRLAVQRRSTGPTAPDKPEPASPTSREEPAER